MSDESVHILAFGAHPDDIEFGCGGVIARETQARRTARFVVCSQGESATNGTPVRRVAEAEKAARVLGASVEFVEFGGDAHFEETAAHVIALARLIRRFAPRVVLAPSVVPNQHPDHAKLGRMVRDAARVARYGGVKELRAVTAHAIDALFFYAVTTEAEPTDLPKILIDVSAPKVLAAWRTAMEAHATQRQTRDYGELQLARSRLHGLRAGVDHAIALFPNDPLVFDSLEPLNRSARRF
jgi:LmbE family N-acetylglucosaminyl deacetylase